MKIYWLYLVPHSIWIAMIWLLCKIGLNFRLMSDTKENRNAVHASLCFVCIALYSFENIFPPFPLDFLCSDWFGSAPVECQINKPVCKEKKGNFMELQDNITWEPNINLMQWLRRRWIVRKFSSSPLLEICC